MASRTARGILDCSMGELLRVRRVLDDIAEQFARACGLRVGELDLVLELLATPDGLGQRELVRRLGVSHASVSSTISNLERRRIVERSEGGDGRSWHVKLVSRDADRALAVNLKTFSDEVEATLGPTASSSLTTLSKLKRLELSRLPSGSIFTDPISERSRTDLLEESLPDFSRTRKTGRGRR